jgi:hypothetical protein
VKAPGVTVLEPVSTVLGDEVTEEEREPEGLALIVMASLSTYALLVGDDDADDECAGLLVAQNVLAAVRDAKEGVADDV